ncbi:tmem145, partial [Symbiodinium sp. CCMP2456]
LSQREDWHELRDFESDTLMNFEYDRAHAANPFLEPQYSFQDLTDMVGEMAHGYGKWQNRECQEMKAELMEADVNGDGLVPVSRFYLQ